MNATMQTFFKSNGVSMRVRAFVSSNPAPMSGNADVVRVITETPQGFRKLTRNMPLTWGMGRFAQVEVIGWNGNGFDSTPLTTDTI